MPMEGRKKKTNKKTKGKYINKEYEERWWKRSYYKSKHKLLMCSCNRSQLNVRSEQKKENKELHF
jgi:hypothetical protein